MFWFNRKKTSTGVDRIDPGSLTEDIGVLKIKIKIIERELEEQHDFIRRLAARRAKEPQRADPSSSPDELPNQDRKSQLRARARNLVSVHRGNDDG